MRERGHGESSVSTSTLTDHSGSPSSRTGVGGIGKYAPGASGSASPSSETRPSPISLGSAFARILRMKRPRSVRGWNGSGPDLGLRARERLRLLAVGRQRLDVGRPRVGAVARRYAASRWSVSRRSSRPEVRQLLGVAEADVRRADGQQLGAVGPASTPRRTSGGIRTASQVASSTISSSSLTRALPATIT